MKDFLGNELKIGDNVIYIRNTSTSAEFRYATIKGFTKTMVLIKDKDEWGDTKKAPYKLIKHVIF